MHCSVLQEPLYCFLFFHKRNSQVADLWARLQRYLLFEIMALGSSKSLKTETNDLFTPFSQGRTKKGLRRAKKPAAAAEGAACVPLQTTFCHHGDNKISCTHNSVPLPACMMADIQRVWRAGHLPGPLSPHCPVLLTRWSVAAVPRVPEVEAGSICSFHIRFRKKLDEAEWSSAVTFDWKGH